MIGEEQVIVSDIAGTTRDSIDTPFEHEGQKYTLIDTAGIRRRKGDRRYRALQRHTRHHRYRAKRRMHRHDRCGRRITEQDKRSPVWLTKPERGIIVVVNKWDLIKKTPIL